ncbi:adenosine deaminase [Raineyella sp. W15-4]|uniref:adenosine deaminase n=1 Tax=Raineyella sp. W15-4 TaxID=3081651 RepID=UPI0029551BB4|nr:adenosine deaminase [Raineyella sp. W15-4]WOQ17952.1 adenosine deaminase [Raineyella sp. W15-4]
MTSTDLGDPADPRSLAPHPAAPNPADPRPLDRARLRDLPKVALHDHLDGGLRPRTLLELAAAVGHPLPADSPAALADWFFEAANSGSLERYLETFEHTVAAMQTEEALHRVAYEFVLDQVDDGVVYAEARWAPEQHLRHGLTLSATVRAVGAGLKDGMAAARRDGHPIIVRQLLTAMRQADRWEEIAGLTIRRDDDVVAGFDIAGPEIGFPPTRHLEAFRSLERAGVPYTIHAGEAAGPVSIAEAVDVCHADRIGHGVRIVEDIDLTGETPVLGEIATEIRELRIPLEVCPTSNLQTGVAATLAEHPVDILHRLGFSVTISCDNRLVSRTTLSREYARLVETFGWTLADIRRTVDIAVGAAFVDEVTRTRLAEVVAAQWPR